MSRGNTLCFPLIGKNEWSWQLAACRDADLPASKVADAQISTWAVAGGGGKHRRKACSRGASASAPGPGEHFSVEAQTGTSTTRWWVWMSATADHSQTKLLFSSHLTTDYMCLILSSHFERTIITSCSGHPALGWQNIGSAGDASDTYGARTELWRAGLGATSLEKHSGPR